MKTKTDSKNRVVGRTLLSMTFLLLGGGLAVLSYVGPQTSARTNTAEARAIGSMIERSAIGKPRVVALLRSISQSIPSFDNSGRIVRSGAMRGANSAQSLPLQSRQSTSALTPVFSEAVSPIVSPAVRNLPPVSPFTVSTGQIEQERELPNRAQTRNPLEHDPAVQTTTAPTVGMPAVSASFEGISNSTGCNGCIPPDPNGAVGPNHYVQMVNSSFAIYNKTGALLSPPKAINTLWSSVPNSTCATHNNGDPIVVYDQLADRWLLSQFTVQSATENYAECIAISTSPDPTGTYYLYQFDESADTFHDYPHIGIWPDGYYMSTNLFPNSGLLFSSGAGAWAFERPKMLLGQAARYVFFDETDLATGCNQGVCSYTPNGQLPTSLEGKNPPPAGMPNYFVEVDNTNSPNASPATGLHNEMHLWKFHVDWTNPANSTFGAASTAPTAKPGFSGMYAGNAGQPDFILPIAYYVPVPCSFASGPTCIPEKITPGQPEEFLEAVGDRLMYRVTYRNFGDHESLIVSHTAEGAQDQPNGAARAGIRWYELRAASTTPTIYQQSTFAPLNPTDTNGPLWRWMGSAAMDHVGDIAVGYSASGPNYNVSLHYAGRLAGDPLNDLTQGEALMFVGNGIEVAVPNYLQRNRWGDYSNLTVDPNDDCTFWYTNEYLPSNQVTDVIDVVNWHTRIASFKFPTCTVSTPPLLSVVSRKTHGGAGTFDIPLPLTGNPGIECRTGGNDGSHTIVFQFANPVVSCGTPSSGTAQVGADAHECVVNLTGVPNGQHQTVSLTGVLDNHANQGTVSVTFGVLLGDVNGTGVVDSGDVFLVRQQTGHTTTGSTARHDVNITGVVDSGDVFVTRQQTGTALQ